MVPSERTRPRSGPPGAATLAAVLLLAACAGFRPPAEAPPEPGMAAALNRSEPHRCAERVARVLAGARVPAAQVRTVRYYERREIYRDRVVGYDAWVALADQPGYLIVDMSETCTPRQIYTRGGAQLPGIAAW